MPVARAIANALLGVVRMTPLAVDGLPAQNCVVSTCMSVAAFAWLVPALAVVPAPFVTLAGLTFATTATAGSTN